MKKALFILFCMYAVTKLYSQNLILHNIFIQKLNYSADNCYKDQKGNLVFFSKVYSSDELKLGQFNMNDSVTVKKISSTKNRYSYLLKETYQKDTIENSFKLINIVVNKRIDSRDLNKIVFKKIPSVRTVFDCNENRFNNVLLLKSFFLTHSLVSEDNEAKKYSIKLIDENCNTLLDEEYDRNLLFSKDDSFLIFKNKDFLVLIFDKYY
ncbi:hypothetical protein [Flavobacterium hungaricum]|nr:hypothetical protein [Flavobacterium hungaricum]